MSELALITHEVAETLGMTPKERRQTNEIITALQRYGDGESLSAIAEDMDCTEETLRRRLKQYDLGAYDEALAKARQSRKRPMIRKTERATSLSLGEMLSRLEDPDMIKALELTDLLKVYDILGKRLALLQGNPTERTEERHVVQVVKFDGSDNHSS